MNFGQAIEALKLGKKISREGWNGKGMFLFQADILEFGASGQIMTDLDPIIQSKKETQGVIIYGKTIVMKGADNSLVFGWLASQTDIVAEDWQIIN